MPDTPSKNQELGLEATVDLRPGDTPAPGDSPGSNQPVSNQPSPSVAAPAAREYPRPFGDYDILDKLGVGGMGVVYKARQRGLNRIVALKLIRAGELADEQEVRRFHAEAEAAAHLEHPSIVPVYEVGKHDGQYFFSMGYVEGPTLAQELANGPLGPRTAAELTRRIAEAVQYAHERGVIHRDLKPQNILLTERLTAAAETQPNASSTSTAGSSKSDVSSSARKFTTPTPKIADFGLAKRMQGSSDLTQSGQILGTPSYMPPEQSTGQNDRIGPAADVYSLGAILYCLLTGRPPFQAANPLDTLWQVREQEPVPPRQLNRSIPLDLETISLRCLRKEPSRRYTTAQELVDELMRFLNGEPILARPVGNLERAWRWCRRKPLAAGLIGATAALVLLLAAAGWYRTQLLASDVRRHTAEQERLRAEQQRLVAEQRRQAADQQRQIAEEGANVSRHYALLNGVREAAANPKPGWTWPALDELRQASEFERRDSRTLRNLAGHCLLQSDVRLERTIKPRGDLELRGIAFDPSGQRLAVGKVKGGTDLEVFVYEVASGEQLHRLAVSTLATSVTNLLSFNRKFQEGVRALSWSPNGDQLAVATRFGKVHIWDLAKVDAPTVTWQADEDIEMMTWLPNDPRLLLTSGASVRLWQHDGTWREVAKCELGFAAVSSRGYGVLGRNWKMRGLALPKLDGRPLWPAEIAGNRAGFAAQTDLLAVESGALVCLVDGRTGEILATLRDDACSAPIASDDLQLSPDGNWLFTIGDDRRLRVWDVGSQRLAMTSRAFDSSRPQVACDARGRRLAIIGEHEVQILELRSGIQRRIALQSAAIHDVDMTPDGQRLVTSSEVTTPVQSQWSFEQRVNVWNCDDGRPTSGQHMLSLRHVYGRHPDLDPGSVRFVNGGSHIAFASRDLGAFTLGAAADHRELLALELPESGQPKASEETVLTSADHQPLMSAVADPLAVDGRSLTLTPHEQEGVHEAWWHAKHNPVSTKSLWHAIFARIRVRRTGQSGELLRIYGDDHQSPPTTDILHAEQIPDDGDHWYQLGVTKADNVNQLPDVAFRLDLAPQTRAATAVSIDQVLAIPLQKDTPRRVQHVRGSRDGAKLWGVYEENQIVCWDAVTGRLLAHSHNLQSTILTGRSGFDDLAAGSDFAVAGCRDGNLFVFTPVAGNARQLDVRMIAGKDPLTSVAISPDETTLAVGTRSGKMRLIDRAAGTVRAEWEAHAEDVTSLAFVGDGRRFATGSAAGQLRIWDLATPPIPSTESTLPSEWLAISLGRAPLVAISASADGQRLAVLVQGEFSVRLFDLAALQDELDRLLNQGAQSQDQLK